MPPNRLSDETNPKDWFYSAADRLQAADVIWRIEGLTHSGIELLQESVERYLKGFLIAKGWKLARTHDLRALLAEAQKFDVQFANFKAMSVELTEDFFAQHYPGGDWTELGKNYETLRKQTGELVDLIRQNLPGHFPAK